ncbi:MAG: hypothetical protein CME71_07690 [Halobacteriovorax sp.]|nr:hypothetical protein [Halobacteriovorax sp.]|tara:strand:+ start:1578 stop:2012 length:435 start_codon:yes stop_codon:yes gene_type:complete
MAENNNDEQIFNEDELQDIMNEFETLEQEFHDDSGEPQSAAHEVVEEEGELNVSEQSNVVSMNKAKPKHSKSTSSDNSNITMSMEFPIGEKVAQIGLNPEYGFSFSLDGVELTVDAENGCVMTLPGGMTFSFPVEEKSKQKKSA